ncbi:TPA: glycosyltransferase, partial [Enterococcus faecium]|nr:glycosyltransferase [Enterococcus faecium]
MSNVSNPLVSVIMGAYNSEKTIGRAIDSIIKQTYLHWEMII